MLVLIVLPRNISNIILRIGWTQSNHSRKSEEAWIFEKSFYLRSHWPKMKIRPLQVIIHHSEIWSGDTFSIDLEFPYFIFMTCEKQKFY
jgi:hypothetical protein